MRHVLFISLKLFTERRRQSLVATLGVVVGTVAFIVMSSMVNGFQNYFLEEALNVNGHVKIRVKAEKRGEEILRAYYGEGFFTVLGEKPEDKKDKITDYRRIEEMYEGDPKVVGISPQLIGSGVVIYGVKEKPATLVGIYPLKEARTLGIDKYLKEGSLQALEENRNGVILGIKLAEDLGVTRVGSKVSILASGETYTLKVLDFLDTGITEIDRSRVYLHIKKLQDILSRPGEVNEMVVKLSDPSLAPFYARKIEKETGYEAESWQEAFKNFLSIFRIQQIITRSVVFAILAVSGFGIFNIVMMTVMEKRRDIAILKAMGYNEREIILIFSLQGMTVGFLGGAVGCLVAYGMIEWLETIRVEVEGIIRTSTLLLDKSPRYYLLGFAFSLFTSLVASSYPAYRASLLHPVEVFRSGG